MVFLGVFALLHTKCEFRASDHLPTLKTLKGVGGSFPYITQMYRKKIKTKDKRKKENG